MVPHRLEHTVQVPLVLGRDGDVVGDAVQQVKLLNGNLVYHVADVDTRDVNSHHPDLVGTLDDVNQLVYSTVLTQGDLRVVDLVLLQDRLEDLRGDVGGGVGELDVELDASLVMPLEVDVGLRLVQSDTEAVQLLLDQLLVGHGLAGIQDHKDQRARSRRADHSLAPSLAVLGPLDDTREIQQLDLSSLVPDDARDTGQGRELVGSRLRVRPRHLRQQRRLADRGEADQTHSRVSCCLHVPPVSSSSCRFHLALDLLPPELRELRLEHTDVRHGRLVLLSPRQLLLDGCDSLR
mmetsp:Transcript_41870/g.132018  ORF Transcript_41870/g.132018 Transcript_41870/m.132018 type:complete len:293 (+) Transcript_41870:287-1165(+)